jgi:mono/diheme cytochrome c family protein
VSYASTKWPGTTEADLSAGKKLFLDNCNRCHGYPDLNAKPDEHWPGTIESMAKKADLNKDQETSLLHFVLASRHP